MADKPEKSKETQANADLILQIVDRARDEVAWVRSAYKFVLVIVAFLIAVGLYFSYRSVQDMKADLHHEAEQTQKQLTNEMQLISRSLQQDLKDEVGEVRKRVSARLDQEFDRDEITKLVATKTQERIDSVANHLIEVQVQQMITPLKEELTALNTKTSEALQDSISKLDLQIGESKEAVSEIRPLLNEARKTLDQLREQSDFVLTVLSAQSDDRAALNKLLAWASDQSNSLQKQAERASFAVIREYSGLTADKPYHTLEWKEGFDPNKMTLQEIRSDWVAIPPTFARAYVEFVWNHPTITKEEKLSFLHDVLSDSKNSLQAANKAASLLATDANVKYNPPFDFSYIEKWWNERSVPSSAPDEATSKAMDDGNQ